MSQIIIPFAKGIKGEDGIGRVTAVRVMEDGSKVDVADIERHFDATLNKHVYQVSNVRNPEVPGGCATEMTDLLSAKDIEWAINRMQDGVPMDNKLVQCFMSENKQQRIDIFENSDATFSIQTHLRAENGAMNAGINRPGIRDAVTLKQELSEIMTESEIMDGIIFNEFKVKDPSLNKDQFSLG